MRNIIVPKINLSEISEQGIRNAFEQNNVPFHSIDCINWDEYPYLPDVKFRIAHTGSAIVLHWIVDEQLVKAEIEENNGAVWTDSCVEFFLSPDNNNSYYNLEMNCIGTTLLGFRKNGEKPIHAEDAIIDNIFRTSSLGKQIFEEQPCDEAWEMVATIPAKSFFTHQISDFSGLKMRANFYKCGDDLSVPHFVSWAEIDTPEPSFHQPGFFGTLDFE